MSAISQNPSKSSWYIAGGLTTLWINRDNAASKPIFPSNDTSFVLGGGIYGQQPGISLQAIYMFDSNRTYRMTFGGDYFFVNGAQRIEQKYFQLIVWHSLNILSLSSGFEYSFATLSLANAKIYAGLEGRASFIENTQFKRYLNYRDFDSSETRLLNVKQPTTRFGATFRLGVEGELLDPLYVNMSISYNAMNLFNRNDNRGELLTPNKLDEVKEHIVGNMFFSFWLQYHL